MYFVCPKKYKNVNNGIFVRIKKDKTGNTIRYVTRWIPKRQSSANSETLNGSGTIIPSSSSQATFPISPVTEFSIITSSTICSAESDRERIISPAQFHSADPAAPPSGSGRISFILRYDHRRRFCRCFRRRFRLRFHWYFHRCFRLSFHSRPRWRSFQRSPRRPRRAIFCRAGDIRLRSISASRPRRRCLRSTSLSDGRRASRAS